MHAANVNRPSCEAPTEVIGCRLVEHLNRSPVCCRESVRPRAETKGRDQGQGLLAYRGCKLGRPVGDKGQLVRFAESAPLGLSVGSRFSLLAGRREVSLWICILL